MEKTITVDKLIENYTKLTSDKVKEEYLNRNIKVINNLSVAVLDVIGTSIINASSFDKDNNIAIDSYKRYILSIFAYINNCTNIEVDSKNWTNEFDILNKYGLVEKIISMIPENVINDIDAVVHMKYDDLVMNYQLKRYDKISYIPESLLLGISDIIEKISEATENKFQQYLNDTSL